MTPKEFYEKVKTMRKVQKLYFATRSISALNKSKELEKEIDAEIARVEEITKQRQEAQQTKLNF